eukprot:gene12980-27397_t
MSKAHDTGGKMRYRYDISSKSRYDPYFSPNNLRIFFDSCMRKSHLLKSERESNNFFQALFSFDNKIELVYNLSDNRLYGKEVLQSALSLSCSNPININSTVIKFLDFIGDNILNIGSTKKCVSDLYLIAYNTPGLLSTIQDLIEKGQVNDLLVIAWFLVSVCRSEVTCRENPQVLGIVKLLEAKGTIVPQLRTLLCSHMVVDQKGMDDESMNEGSLEYLRAIQPQHDNDFIDYRKVSIVPTASEINSGISVCCSIASSASNLNTHADKEKWNEASLLDRQFRLLREDMVAPMREEIQKELKVVKHNRKRMYDSPFGIRAVLTPIPCVLIKVSMPIAIRNRIKTMTTHVCERFFEEAGHRILSRESLVAFITNNQVVNIGVIVRRITKDEFIAQDGYFCVGVSFFGDSLINAISMMGKKQKRHKGLPNFIPMADVMFQATTSYFSYEPVLRCLQGMSEIPFAEEIVKGQNPLPIEIEEIEEEEYVKPVSTQSFSLYGPSTSTYASRTRSGSPQRSRYPDYEDDDDYDYDYDDYHPREDPMNFHLPEDIRQLLENDSSQLRAVEMSLTQRVSLIQGPPGTGKTFVGVQIARSLIANNCHRILCLCYTNHALDSFLEELIAVGVPKRHIVRIGKSPRISDELQDCCLNSTNETRFNRQQSYRYAILKRQEELLSHKFRSLENLIYDSSDWKWSSWNAVSEYLKDEGSSELSDVHDALSCPSFFTTGGYLSVGKKGKAKSEDYYFKRWYNGQSREDNVNLFDDRSNHAIWKLSKPERLVLLKNWSDDNKQPLLDKLARTMREYETTKETIEELRNETKLYVLQNAYIIGCTTTSAAKNKSLLADVQLNAIMIEEAAEILEAH